MYLHNDQGNLSHSYMYERRLTWVQTVFWRVFVCLFVVWGLSSHSRMFHSYGDVIMTGEGLQMLTYARHSWPLSSEGSLTCHTHCLRHGPTVYNGHLRGPVTLTPNAKRLAMELSLPVFTTWVCRHRASNPDLPHARRTHYL